MEKGTRGSEIEPFACHLRLHLASGSYIPLNSESDSCCRKKLINYSSGFQCFSNDISLPLVSACCLAPAQLHLDLIIFSQFDDNDKLVKR